MPSASPDGLTIARSGLEVARASLSARQAKAMGLLTDLWPHFFHLISECRPQHVFGEQVAAGNANHGSTLYKQTWKEWDTPSGLCRLRQRASVRRTSESGLLGGRRVVEYDIRSADRNAGRRGIIGWHWRAG
jgi:hypothetical protein